MKHIELAKHIKPLFILLSTGFAVELYTKLDTTTLGIMTSEEYVGYYNYATKISSIVVGLAASVSTILLPRFSLYREQNKMEELKKTIENVGVLHKNDTKMLKYRLKIAKMGGNINIKKMVDKIIMTKK